MLDAVRLFVRALFGHLELLDQEAPDGAIARVQELEKRLGVSPKVDHHPEKITGRVPLDQRVSDLEMSAAPVSAKSDVDAKLDEILRKRAARKRRSGK